MNVLLNLQEISKVLGVAIRRFIYERMIAIFGFIIMEVDWFRWRGLPQWAHKYGDEEIKTDYNYPTDYKIKPLTEQIETLACIFNLKKTEALAYATDLPRLPEGAEGWFAIVRHEAVALTYAKVLHRGFALLRESRAFCNYESSDDSERWTDIYKTKTTRRALAEVTKKQEGDILIIPAQFGLRHRGKSLRRAGETCSPNEFGLGVFEVLCMLLNHPEREQQCKQIHITCGGDQYYPNFFSEGNYCTYVPSFWFFEGENYDFDNGLRFSQGPWDVITTAHQRYGTASGFIL